MRQAFAVLVLFWGTSGCTLPFADREPGCDPLTDDFEDAMIDPFWENAFETPPTTLDERGGELVFSFGAGGDGFSGYLSGDLDLTRKRTRVRIVEAPSPASTAQAFFKVEFPFPDTAMLLVEEGLLRARLTRGEATDDIVSVPFDASTHRYLQLRHDGETVFWETSADGVAFEPLASRDGFDFTRARVGILAGTYQPEAAAGAARFDEFALDCR